MLTPRKLHKILQDAGHRRSEYFASSRVKGWGNSTEGYKLKKIEENVRRVRGGPGRCWVKVGSDVTGFTVSHIGGSWNQLRGEEYIAHESAKLDAYGAALEKAGVTFERKGDEIHIPATVAAPVEQ